MDVVWKMIKLSINRMEVDASGIHKIRIKEFVPDMIPAIRNNPPVHSSLQR